MPPTVIKFIYNLPYQPRAELCSILDFNNDWRTLGGSYMNFTSRQLFQMEQAILRRESPTEELLSKWGAQNHTVLELFKHLYAMRHYQAMLILKPYVESKYHTCIPEGCSDNRTILQEQSSVFSAQNHNVKSARVNFENEAGVRQENNPGNEPTRKVSDPLTPMNVLGGTPHIPYQELTLATNNWDKLNILGKGGFGTVYKGVWEKTTIAVKKLEVHRNDRAVETLNQCQREQSLRELKYLNSCRHDNILPLYGICFETGKYCLVYRYMPNGSLEDRLLMKKNTPSLLWTQRLHIAKGTSLGLQFLHSREPPLIHGDIKSANILLNHHMDPVIGDFGLTQEGPIEKATHITLKRVNGTRPYLPHEFLVGKRLSTKVDVYGFGIVLFELATGMRAYDDTRRSERHLKSLVEKYSEENMYDLVDKNAQPIELNIAYAFFRIGKQSTKQNPKERPEMTQVYNMLSGSGGESPNATGPTLPVSMPTSSGVNTPIRTLSPNNIPRYKFGKTLESGVPYLPPPLQMINSPHLLQRTGSLVNDNFTRFPVAQHLTPNYAHVRLQETGSQNNELQKLGPDMVPTQYVRSNQPHEVLSPSRVPSSSQQQQQPQQQLPVVITSESDSSHSQDVSHAQCNSSCDHSTSSTDESTSLEIIDSKSELSSVVQNNKSQLSPEAQDTPAESSSTTQNDKSLEIIPVDCMPVLQLLSLKK